MATANLARDAALPVKADDLVHDHQAEIWRYLRFLGCDGDEAADLTQETFLAALRKRPADLGRAAVRGYLRKIARNLYLAQFRTSRPPEFDLSAAEEVWVAVHKNDGGETLLAALDDCLSTVEGRARKALDLAYRDNRSRAEMAEELELSEDGVKSLLRRTREALRKCIERKIGG